MGQISQIKRHKYYKIFEQIYESPLMSISSISQNTGFARNTVAKYVKEMYAHGILVGPSIRMKPSVTYKEYVYLMNFSDPWLIFNRLKEFPHVLYHAMTFGDWNTMVITDELLDFSKLTGFEKVIKHSVRYCSYTPKPEYMNWNESFKKEYDRINQFTPLQTEYRNRPITSLDWGEDQWKLFYAFKFMRKKIMPLLRKIDVKYEVYVKWMNSLEEYCTIHTGIYPDEYQNYSCYCFLVDTDYEESVKSLFSLFPTTSFITELEKQLLCFAHVTSSDVKRKLICLLYDMETKTILTRFNQAVVLFHSQYTPGS